LIILVTKEIINIMSYGDVAIPKLTDTLQSLLRKAAISLAGSFGDLSDKSRSLRNLSFSGILKMVIDLLYLTEKVGRSMKYSFL
jgi:hypothetical protein